MVQEDADETFPPEEKAEGGRGMMLALHIAEAMLFAWVALSVLYVALFALASLRGYMPPRQLPHADATRRTFHVLFPAYAEDAVILDSVRTFLQQDYPRECYRITVISDHMTPSTNNQLIQLPIQTLIATYDHSSKAKALQLAISQTETRYDYAVVLDADNHVTPDFLSRLNAYCTTSDAFFQCHRTAKNTNTRTAMLDAVSEEINNSIFRLGHNCVGLSSALIGSGMCLPWDWFCRTVPHLHTTGEDKELEAIILSQRRHIHYLQDVLVYDEKTQTQQGFSHQRRRWIAAQFHALCSMCRHIQPNADYLDKVLQQMLLPRSITLCTSTLMCLTMHPQWWAPTALLALSLLLAIPRRLLTWRLLHSFIMLPLLVVRMLGGMFHLRGLNKEFLHTKHST